MSLTQCGPVCDVCGNFILPLGDEKVSLFDVWGLKNLIAHYECKNDVERAHAAKDWKLLRAGPLRTAWENQEAIKNDQA